MTCLQANKVSFRVLMQENLGFCKNGKAVLYNYVHIMTSLLFIASLES